MVSHVLQNEAAQIPSYHQAPLLVKSKLKTNKQDTLELNFHVTLY